MKKALGIFISLLVFSLSLMVVYLSMRSVMAVGGYCAEGGAYQIAVHCPKGVTFLMPLSIFAMTIAGLIYAAIVSSTENSPQWYFFFWSALFGSLGWNFLDFAMHPPAGMSDGGAIGWWVCGVMFLLMAVVPLLIIIFGASKSIMGETSGGFGSILFGKQSTGPAVGVGQNTLVAIHGIAVVIGYFLGIYLFYLLT